MSLEKVIQSLRPQEIEMHMESLPRCAGKVKRWHMEFTVQSQTISDHVYNIFRIYYTIYWVPEPEVFSHILFHDAEEYLTGDLPHWFAAIPEVHAAKVKEEKKFEKIHGLNKLPMDEHKFHRIRVCDWIEAMEFMVDEVNLGNDSLRHKLERLFDKLMDHCRDDPWKQNVSDYLEKSGFMSKYNYIMDGVHRG
jgi:hypothetical protein